jgi:RNA polymerase sigma-54 factor
MIRQNLSQKLLQKLTPQQIQLMKLLQVPTVGLEQRIKDELEANPALEEAEGEEFDYEMNQNENENNEEDNYEDDIPDEVMQNDELEMDKYFEDDEPNYKYQQGYSNDDEEKSLPVALEKDFFEYLNEQLGILELNSNEYLIGQQIVGSIDDDGYLRRDIEAIIDDIAFSFGFEPNEKEVIDVLQQIQQLDPPGIAARDLQECLIIQLKRKEQKEDIDQLSLKILQKNFEEFTKKHYEKLQKVYEINTEELKKAIDNILELNPKPASAYNSGTNREINYIIPDFIIFEKNGILELTLNNRNLPELRVSDSFREMIETYRETGKNDPRQKEAVQFIKQKIDAAKWFIDAIKQRQQTLHLTMQAILDYQYEYFKTGDESNLKPMILKDIADMTGLDISTISRVSNSKYVETEFGVIPLRYFFSEAMSTDSGEDVSTREVKKILQECVEDENKTNPLSDQDLTEILQKKGYNIARRTVAKYREQLNIPVARLRKQI